MKLMIPFLFLMLGLADCSRTYVKYTFLKQDCSIVAPVPKKIVDNDVVFTLKKSRDCKSAKKYDAEIQDLSKVFPEASSGRAVFNLHFKDDNCSVVTYIDLPGGGAEEDPKYRATHDRMMNLFKDLYIKETKFKLKPTKVEVTSKTQFDQYCGNDIR